jgi:hypothetical protein
MINDEEHHILPHTNIPQVVEAMRKAEEKRREALRGNRWDGERLWMGTRTRNGIIETGEFGDVPDAFGVYHLWQGIKVFPNGNTQFGTFDHRAPNQPLWLGYKNFTPGFGPHGDPNRRSEVGVFQTQDAHNLLYMGDHQ